MLNSRSNDGFLILSSLPPTPSYLSYPCLNQAYRKRTMQVSSSSGMLSCWLLGSVVWGGVSERSRFGHVKVDASPMP